VLLQLLLLQPLLLLLVGGGEEARGWQQHQVKNASTYRKRCSGTENNLANHLLPGSSGAGCI